MAPLRDAGPPDPPQAVYLHVPFCRDRCTYCAFPTVADDPSRHGAVVDALIMEARRAPHVGPLRSLYLGGGTPGLLDPDLLQQLVVSMGDIFGFKKDVEVSLEVNPVNVGRARLGHWAGLGVTRLSLGVQTFRDDVLHGLARRHDAGQAFAALEDIATHWHATWSADLLVGWHGQDAEALEDDLERLLGFDPPHISVYGLTIEKGTPLARRAAQGHAVTAPSDMLDGFDEAWSRRLAARGYERYEVSNFARIGHRSAHNAAYWSNASYLGLGPGAASSVHPHRWTNRPDLESYLQAVRRGHGVRISAERLEPAERLLETLAIGLRTSGGLKPADLDRRFGTGWRERIERAGTSLVHTGLLAMDAESLRIPAEHLTKADRIVLDLARGMQQVEDIDDSSEASKTIYKMSK